MNTDTIMMKRCPSHEDNYELKPRPLLLQIKQNDEEKEKEEEEEDEGKYTCSHGVEMSRRDTTVCDTCYWDSRPTDEATNYNDSLLQLKQVKDHEGEKEKNMIIMTKFNPWKRNATTLIEKLDTIVKDSRI